ncbi:MAG: relaxase/mobilization nuclease domain-containing protein [Oscillospiraceae bacterium]|nr:relaxase/mobilization nuclease domain-containing protein [Oscillospiraceae bacterium]
MHYIQSFESKDNISLELAHQILRTFARKTFDDNYQVVIAAFSAKPIMPFGYHTAYKISI